MKHNSFECLPTKFPDMVILSKILHSGSENLGAKIFSLIVFPGCYMYENSGKFIDSCQYYGCLYWEFPRLGGPIIKII